MGLNLRPLGDRLVIEPNEEEAQTSPGGIIIPDTAKEKPQKGTVVAAGPGRTTDEGKVIDLPVKVGDVVIYSKYAGDRVHRERHRLSDRPRKRHSGRRRLGPYATVSRSTDDDCASKQR